MMRVAEQVRRLIERLSPEPICDDCIAEKLALSLQEEASRAATELAGSGGFERRKDACAICGEAKMVIGKR